MDKRKVIVEIETADGQLARFDGLNVKFTIKKSANAVMNKAEIGIANLSMERVYNLTTFMSPHLNEEKRKMVQIFAGYVKDPADEVPLIFQGEITRALPTMPPDVWLNCEARSGFYNNQNVVSVSVNGKTTVKDICARAARELGLQLSYTATTNKAVEGFSHSGGATNMLARVNELGGVIAFEDDGVLKVIDADKPETSEYIRVLNRHSGLIGMPQPDNMGLKMKMLLDPTFKVGDRVRLESEMLPKANGVYWCYGLTHSGSLRDTDFYTEIEAKRMDI